MGPWVSGYYVTPGRGDTKMLKREDHALGVLLWDAIGEIGTLRKRAPPCDKGLQGCRAGKDIAQ